MQFQKTLSLLAIVTLFPTNALALSCTHTGFDLIETAKANKASGKNAIYVKGDFSNVKTNIKTQKAKKPTLLKDTKLRSINQQGTPVTGTASLKGNQMTSRGEKRFKAIVKIKTTCAGPWCGKAPKPNQKTIIALIKKGATYEFTSGPCSPNTFTQNIDSDWKRLKKLLR